MLAIVLQAVQRVGSRALKSRPMLVLAALAFIGIFFLRRAVSADRDRGRAHRLHRARAPGRRAFQVGGDHGAGGRRTARREPARRRTARACAADGRPGAARVGDLARALARAGHRDRRHARRRTTSSPRSALFFSKMAVVTFGGAYAVLAYMAQQAVETYGWLKPGEMLDGLGMAETTPGPLIMVVQFVGFLAAYRDPGALPPMLAGTLGGLLATWCTFVPCFLWIGLGAPFIEKLRDNKPLSGALAGITAAVVGVILNLAIWFALHTWFREAVHLRGFGLLVRCSGSRQHRSVGAAALGRRHGRDLPLQGRNDPDPARLLGGRRAALPRGSDLMSRDVIGSAFALVIAGVCRRRMGARE